MALEIEIWHDTIYGKLREDNTFLNHVADVSEENIVNGTIVHIPQAGNPSKVEKNRTLLPAQVKTRLDGQVLYAIDEYTTDPVLIKNAETKELSYDKRLSVLDEDIENLSEEVAEGMLTNFVISPIGDNPTLPKEHILFTNSSEIIDATVAGATGKRKAYSLKDLQRMQVMFREQKAWKEGQMFSLLTPEAAVQLFPADSAVTATYMAAVSQKEREEGIIYNVQGWKIMIRSSVYVLNEDKDFKAFGAIGAANDSDGCLFWNKNMLEKAIGKTEAFDDLGNPVYYGDIYSFLVRCGGRARRKGYEGVAVLMQAMSV